MRRPPAGLIVYWLPDFKQLRTCHRAQQSMSRRSNRYDNANAAPRSWLSIAQPLRNSPSNKDPNCVEYS